MNTFMKVMALVNLTRNPELRYAPSGTPIAKFGVACSHTFTSNGEKKEDKSYADVVAFGKTAEACAQYIQKGSTVFIEGRLTYNSWETQDGQKRSKLEITCEKITFLDKKGDNRGGDEGGYSGPDDDGPRW